MKKLLLLVVALMATATFSAQDFNDGTFNYKITDAVNFKCEVFSIITPVASITIPATALNSSTATTYDVTGVGSIAFSALVNAANNVIASVSLPTSVVAIGDNAFANLTNLKTINLNNVVTIGANGFSGCTGVTDLGNTSKVITLGNYCFNNCKSLTKLELPALVTIGTGSIYNSVVGAGGISTFNIPSTVTTIGTILLGRLQNLTAVQLNWQNPATDVVIGAANFFRNLTLANIKVYVPVGTKAKYYATPAMDALWRLFPEANIIEGTLPTPSLDPIGTLFTVNNIQYRVTSVDNLTVEVASSTLAAVTVPPTVTKADGDAKTYSVTAIGASAFLDNATVTSLALPTSVTVVKANAFSGCINLETINLDKIVSIETQNAFFNCPKLTTANLAAVTAVGNFTFHSLGNSTLSSISIPSMVTIGGSAFRTSVIPTISIPATVTSIASRAFMDCMSLNKIQVSWATAGAIPVITADVFENLTTSGITLYVPNGTSGFYAAVDVWKDFTIVEGVLGTNKLDRNVDFNVYPNPTSGKVFIKSNDIENAALTVYDITGRVVLNKKLAGSESEISLANEAAGVYLIKVKSANSETVKRIVKQ